MTDPDTRPPSADDKVIQETLAAVAVAKSLEEDRGTFSCPRCETGTITYGRASSGHTRGRCDNGGCISWME